MNACRQPPRPGRFKLFHGVQRGVVQPFRPRVVYKQTRQPDGSTKRTGRTVVNLRDLNAVSERDIYPVPNQADILSIIHGKRFLTVFDAAKNEGADEIRHAVRKTRVLLPTGRLSMLDVPGQVFWGPEADEVLFST